VTDTILCSDYGIMNCRVVDKRRERDKGGRERERGGDLFNDAGNC
jgi:hypothetical protein